jgi:hypothetical protein
MSSFLFLYSLCKKLDRIFKKFGGASLKIKPVISPLNLGDPFVHQKIKVLLVLDKWRMWIYLSLISKLGWQLLSGHNTYGFYFFNKVYQVWKFLILLSYPWLLDLGWYKGYSAYYLYWCLFYSFYQFKSTYLVLTIDTHFPIFHSYSSLTIHSISSSPLYFCFYPLTTKKRVFMDGFFLDGF